jgi:hypothetical protein
MERMHQLADEIRETFEERGFRIGQAVQLDGAFGRSRRPQSTLGRALVLDAVEEATARIGLGYRTVTGGGCDIIDVVDFADRRFRVRKAEVDPDTGDYKIISPSDSILTVDAEPDSLLPTERWVLGYTVDDDGLVVDIFAAEVRGITQETVPRLELGPVTLLGAGGSATPPTGGGFLPPDEDDLGDDLDDGDFGDDTGEASAS